MGLLELRLLGAFDLNLRGFCRDCSGAHERSMGAALSPPSAHGVT
jgi:hypothetical protein